MTRSDNDLPLPRLESLRARIHAQVATLADLRSVQQRRPAIDRLLADLDAQIQRSERAAVLALVGATGAGKSSMLNALIGEDVAPVGPDRPTTRVPVIFAPDDADITELTAAARGHVPGDSPAWQVRRYRPLPGQPGYVIIDTPDTNSVSADPGLARSLAEHCDILVVVFHRQSIVESEPVTFLDEFARRRALVFVLNRTDELPASSVEALKAQIRRLSGNRWSAADAPVLGLSAALARRDPQQEEWQALTTTLDRISAAAELRRVRRFNTLGTVARLGELFAEVKADCGELLAALPEQTDTGLEQLGRKLADDDAEAWRLRRSDLRRLLYNEIGRRWEGASGWAVRVGGLESAGLGLGAVLLRRHPVIAAGSAIGSTVAARAIEASEQETIRDRNALAPPAGQFEAWYAECLSPARLTAGQLTGDPEAFGLPGREGAYLEMARRLGDVWAQLIERQVPRAIEGAWIRWLRWPLDLPVYAFAGWIAYRVVAGFLVEHYAGIDFLVNAALIGFGYLLLVRLFLRRLLALRARRMAAVAAADASERLASWRKEIGARVRARVDELRHALEGLASPP